MFKVGNLRTSLAVQWLQLNTSNAGEWVQSLVRELRSHIPHNVAKNFSKEKKKQETFKKSALISCRLWNQFSSSHVVKVNTVLGKSIQLYIHTYHYMCKLDYDIKLISYSICSQKLWKPLLYKIIKEALISFHKAQKTFSVLSFSCTILQQTCYLLLIGNNFLPF